MPQFPKTSRVPLKMHPEPEEQLARVVRALEGMVTGLQNIVDTIDALVVENEAGEKCLRMAKP